ncbi:hypothetical protein GCM10022226_38620 [Sphaerisporangium flaviroseum]|uniref:Uncharacterized protein n=1 Tax=Sphaerisporangium flaviroseum TaxID=509199 RepID=A0ABP7IB66_9ACTN
MIARAERRRRAYTPEEVRSRLRDRLAEASAAGPQPVTTPPAAADPTRGPLARRIPERLRALLPARTERTKAAPLRKW